LRQILACAAAAFDSAASALYRVVCCVCFGCVCLCGCIGCCCYCILRLHRLLLSHPPLLLLLRLIQLDLLLCSRRLFGWLHRFFVASAAAAAIAFDYCVCFCLLHRCCYRYGMLPLHLLLLFIGIDLCAFD
jgi:hypothetical protein